MSKKKNLPTKKQSKAAAIKLHSLIVRDAANGCAALGHLPGVCVGPLQCAHLISKEQAGRISTATLNGVGLCAKHHQVIDKNRVRWLQLLDCLFLRELVHALQEHQDQSMENEIPRNASWWRNESGRLYWQCVKANIATESLPAYMVDYFMQIGPPITVIQEMMLDQDQLPWHL